MMRISAWKLEQVPDTDIYLFTSPDKQEEWGKLFQRCKFFRGHIDGQFVSPGSLDEGTKQKVFDFVKAKAKRLEMSLAADNKKAELGFSTFVHETCKNAKQLCILKKYF